ncbi:thiolase family protein [Rhodococcus tibetensis]|uniref:Thiolase family protein n=1 Tax=Rhodococcus tibetensis TaxID=2965064 RepID=A0ABT1QLX7_9NOCA|nr:thiolase family protein [Rhodococcus sp. FXJ9.536]MCQ4122095.1 thiolase family protein [Rhodococcus sp. FXJ9.536]
MTTSSAAIVGLGMSELGKVYGYRTEDLAAAAVRRAVADAGLTMEDVDGLLVSSGMKQELTPQFAGDLGLHELGLLASLNAYGATAGVMVAQADKAISDGTASTIVCVFADTPLRENKRTGAAWSSSATHLSGYRGWQTASGAVTPNILYALATRRHMETFGTTYDQLATIAVGQRQWAAANPLAQMREPITLDDHHNSPWVADPLRRLDCCLVSNGAVAIVLTSADRAADLPQQPVHVWGYGQAHRPRLLAKDSHWGLETGAVASGAHAMTRAGVTHADIDFLELYDCYTYTVLVTLEDYGFCPKGEGGPFAAEGHLAPGGSLPCNTGGGQLSSYYMWGFTPLSEAIIQIRGDGGERQVPNNGLAMVSGNGGILEYHSTVILGREARA